jgi:circadian clock protein KaiC
MQFLYNGVIDHAEPGVFVAFEERADDLVKNFASMGMDLGQLMERGKLRIDHVQIERNQVEETGEYTLDGLFIRLDHAINAINAKRVVLDTVDVVFSELENTNIIRSELKRLFEWLQEKGVTSIVTGERGNWTLTRYGIEEYVADCVIDLEHPLSDQIATRRMRIIKYRGSGHGTNEYPFLIDHQGMAVLPITSLALDHSVSTERVTTGIPDLDEMMGGNGFFRGSSVLVSGMAGTGKTSVAAAFMSAMCREGEKGLWFCFEEAPQQIQRNMASIGMDLKSLVDGGKLIFHGSRPTFFGLEMHLVQMIRLIDKIRPSVVVVDPISNLNEIGTRVEARAMLNRLIDFLKSNCITAMFTNCTPRSERPEQDVTVSTLMDTWIFLRELESNGERIRGIYVLKSRGMAHSNQIREFVISDDGINLVDIYMGPDGALIGGARLLQEAKDKAESLAHERRIESLKTAIDRKRHKMEREIEEMRAELEAEQKELELAIEQESITRQVLADGRKRVGLMRQAVEAHVDDGGGE